MMSENRLKRFHIAGRVINAETRRGVEGLRVEGWDKDLVLDDFLGSAQTDAQGSFRLDFDESHFRGLVFDRRPDLFLKVLHGDRLLAATDPIEVSEGGAGETDDITIEVEAAARAENPTARTALPVSGNLVNALSGYPLAGFYVCAYFVEPSSEAESAGAGRVLLGDAMTDSAGGFEIEFHDSERVRSRLRLLEQDGAGSLVIEAGVPGGEPLHTLQAPRAVDHTPLSVRVELPEVPVTAEHWKQLGARLEEARLVQLHAIVAELTTVPPARSLFGDWSPELRHSVVAELERAFVDPDRVLRSEGRPPTLRELRSPVAWESLRGGGGDAHLDARFVLALSALEAKTHSFDGLDRVDWVLDVSGFKDGDPEGVLKRAEEVYRKEGKEWTVFDAGGLVFGDREIGNIELNLLGEAPAELIPYRNYLRTIFTGAKGSPQYDALKAKLHTRLHQDFETTNLTRQPANKILIHILMEILTAPTGSDYGFGRDEMSVPMQGNLSDREYLDFLIKLTKVTARELSFRFRVDFERPDSAVSSAVEENIAALQGFYRDTPESAPDPHPVVEPQKAGLAPFFLYFDEWRQQTKPFFPENFYQLTRTVSAGVRHHAKMIELYQNSSRNIERWGLMLIFIEDKMSDAHRKFGPGQYAAAAQLYDECLRMALDALAFYKQNRAHFNWVGGPSEAAGINEDIEAAAETVNEKPMSTPDDLENFMTYFEIVYKFDQTTLFINDPKTYTHWLKGYEARLRLMLIHLIAYVLPVCRGDVALAAGDYPTASSHYSVVTRFIVGRADAEDFAGYRTIWPKPASLFLDGPLPYTVDLSPDRETKDVAASAIDTLKDLEWADSFASGIARSMVHPMEKRFFRLRHGNALLEWADALYRTDEPSNISRARELYKAVMLLHGEQPPVSPTWTSALPATGYSPHSENPALESQKVRALRGFKQLGLGLNYYGLDDTHVPWLRYRTLKDAADRSAAAAKSAQHDFLSYMGRLEEGLREGIVNANMLKKAKLQARVAEQQKGVAEYNVSAAKQQVAQVKAAIEAKKKEMEKHEELVTQLKEWVGGFKGALTEVGGEGVMKSGAENAAAGGAATSGLAATASPMAAYALFLYAGITSAANMAEARDKRHAELRALKEQALPWAEEGVRAREREVAIAKLQQSIAEADAELAVALMKFQESRFLNVEFWGQVSVVVKRLMRRYLEMGARFAWLAERALAYEQDRALDIIRLDYFPPKLQGVTGVDLLQLDLAELEAARLDQLRTLVPVKHTYSLAFDFPLQFVELKRTGSCRFQTTELPFRQAYPGTYGHRIIALNVAVKAVNGTYPARGLLRNEGVSLVSRINGETHYSVRFPDAFPLSEFRLSEDMLIYSLPGEALMSFEGSGVETFWELVFPTHANPYGFQSIADIQLTFDVRASYSPTLYAKDMKALPSRLNRFLNFSARVFSPAGLLALKNVSKDAPSEVELSFDLTLAPLPHNETDRRITNLYVAFVTAGAFDLTVKFGPKGGPTTDMPLQQGAAYSNGGAWNSQQQPPQPPQVLNQFINSPVEKVWQLKLDKNLYPHADFSQVFDVVLGVEYEAQTA